jgi:hypothetical protein
MEKQDTSGDSMVRSTLDLVPKTKPPLKEEPHTPMAIQARIITNPQDLKGDRLWKQFKRNLRDLELANLLEKDMKL